jgi:hypothetical protein
MSEHKQKEQMTEILMILGEYNYQVQTYCVYPMNGLNYFEMKARATEAASRMIDLLKTITIV